MCSRVLKLSRIRINEQKCILAVLDLYVQGGNNRNNLSYRPDQTKISNEKPTKLSHEKSKKKKEQENLGFLPYLLTHYTCQYICYTCCQANIVGKHPPKSRLASKRIYFCIKSCIFNDYDIHEFYDYGALF